jgi:hypothetical protein
MAESHTHDATVGRDRLHAEPKPRLVVRSSDPAVERERAQLDPNHTADVYD